MKLHSIGLPFGPTKTANQTGLLTGLTGQLGALDNLTRQRKDTSTHDQDEEADSQGTTQSQHANQSLTSEAPSTNRYSTVRSLGWDSSCRCRSLVLQPLGRYRGCCRSLVRQLLGRYGGGPEQALRGGHKIGRGGCRASWRQRQGSCRRWREQPFHFAGGLPRCHPLRPDKVSGQEFPRRGQCLESNSGTRPAPAAIPAVKPLGRHDRTTLSEFNSLLSWSGIR